MPKLTAAPTPPPPMVIPKMPPTTTVSVPAVPTKNFRYSKSVNHICAGVAYTANQAIGCNGWQGLSEVQCQEKCSNNAKAPGCPAKQCLAAAYFSNSGWCHLWGASQCQSLMPEQYVTTYTKTAKTLFDSPGLESVKHAFSTPVAQNVLKAGAVAAAAAVAAGGVAAALSTRRQPEAAADANSTRSTIAPPGGDGVFLPSHSPTGPTGTPLLAGAPTFRPLERQVNTTAAPAWDGTGYGLTAAWLPLVILFICCVSACVTAIAFKAKRGRVTRPPRSYSQDSEEDPLGTRSTQLSRHSSMDSYEEEEDYEEEAAD